MHPEPAAQILSSGAHRGSTAFLRVFVFFSLLHSGGRRGPHETLGHDRLCGWSPKDRSEEESRGAEHQQKSRRLLALAPERRFSATLLLFHLLPDSGLFVSAGVFLRGERSREERKNQQKPVIPLGHGDRKPPESAVHQGAAEQKGEERL